MLLYRRAAADLRNSVVDPRRLLLRLDTLPPPNFDELDKVRVSDKQSSVCDLVVHFPTSLVPHYPVLRFRRRGCSAVTARC